MSSSVFTIGDWVRVTSYSPFRGLKGQIQVVAILPDDLEEPCSFYLVALEGNPHTEPIWFEYHDVEPLGFRVIAPPPLHTMQKPE